MTDLPTTVRIPVGPLQISSAKPSSTGAINETTSSTDFINETVSISLIILQYARVQYKMTKLDEIRTWRGMFIDQTRDRAGGGPGCAKNRYDFELDFEDFGDRLAIGRRLVGYPPDDEDFGNSKPSSDAPFFCTTVSGTVVSLLLCGLVRVSTIPIVITALLCVVTRGIFDS